MIRFFFVFLIYLFVETRESCLNVSAVRFGHEILNRNGVSTHACTQKHCPFESRTIQLSKASNKWIVIILRLADGERLFFSAFVRQ